MQNSNGHSNDSRTEETGRSPLPIRPLTSKQERKLVDYLDGMFLELTRNFKKRSQVSSTLKTLSDYLESVRRILALVLQIPPVDPSTSLRTAYLLRLTGDALGAIPGYTLNSSNLTMQQALQDLIDFLDDLDQAWLAVLQGQIWDPTSAEGIDLILPVTVVGPLTASSANDNPTSSLPYPPNLRSTPPSQTDVTRLRSLLYSGQSALEEWLVNERAQPEAGSEDEPEDISAMLARMGLLDDYDSLFTRTLDFLRGFTGNVSRNTVDPQRESVME